MCKTLAEYYNALPQQTSPKSDFLRQVMCECGVSFTTAMNWAKGKVKPSSKKYIEKLSELTGIPKEQLFA